MNPRTVRFSTITLILIIMFGPATLGCKLLVYDDLPVPEPEAQVVFRDDFSDTDSGWIRVSEPTGVSDYMDGVYRILVNETNVDVWSKPGLSLADVRIEVDAFKVGGDRDNRFGIICRAVDDNSFYTFIISSDGYFGIGMINDDNYQLIGMDALQPSDAIQLGSALNHLRADCVGDTLTLYANGVQLASVQDTTFASGDVGLIAGTYDTPGTDIRFDNFIVYRP